MERVVGGGIGMGNTCKTADFQFCLGTSDDTRFSHLNNTNKKLICIFFSILITCTCLDH